MCNKSALNVLNDQLAEQIMWRKQGREQYV